MTNLERIRVEQMLSIEELAEKSNVSIKLIRSMEQNKKKVNMVKSEVLYKLAQALNCSCDDLVECDIL